MAEIAVNLVIDKLAPLLIQEVKLLTGVRDEVKRIKDDLESIQSFLKDADGKTEINHSIKTWVKQLRQVSYDMEDAIDEYLALNSAEGADHQRGCTAFLQKALCCVKKLGRRHEIQQIRTKIQDIKERRDLNLVSLEQGCSTGVQSVPRLESLFIDEADLVGIEEPKDQLINKLVEGELKRTVIPLVGMGGLGKTTLAKKVFDNQEVKGHFEVCNAWISVSQSYKLEEILRTMMKQLCQARKEEYAPEGANTTEEVQHLIGKLRECLLQKRYLVVFDDVWVIEFWESIKFALPNNEKGSRIIVTTRSGDVALSCIDSPADVFKLQPLPREKAWKLFCKKVFRSDDCPKELEQLSHEIVKKCQGLPLAIVVIGGLLSMKNKVAYQWQLFRDSLPSELESNTRLQTIRRILSLSYQDLPYYLKSCFLYLAIFPEDYSIRRSRLIRLWIAEGFVKETKGKTLEDVAEEYLNELMQRSLVQISEVDRFGRVRECQLHDLMREILLSKYREFNFCQVVTAKEDLTSCDGSIRRLSIQNYEDYIPESTDMSKVRSIFLFEKNAFPKQFTDTFVTKYRLLKVLDFEGASLENVAEEVGNLFHLRYLSVRSTRVRTLPKSIGKLHNLQTLDLKRTLVDELQVEILGLHKLRHLLAYGTFNGVKVPEGIGCLEALQKLSIVEADGSDCLLIELKKLRQLKTLRITKLKRENGMALCAAIEKMDDLLSLSVDAIAVEELLDMQSISPPPRCLQRLYLRGRLEKLPDWISNLDNIVRIRLYGSRLSDDPLHVLQSLPNLLELRLVEAYDGEHLHFEASGFQKLKVLLLMRMDKPSLVTIEQGALPLLEELLIWRCPGLEAQRICDLRSLRQYQQHGGGPHSLLTFDHNVLLEGFSSAHGIHDLRSLRECQQHRGGPHSLMTTEDLRDLVREFISKTQRALIVAQQADS